MRNNNTHREVSIRNVVVFDPRRRGDVAPVSPLSTARDAIVEIEGIEVVRPSNSIDDLVENVTLNLRGLSQRPVEVTVEPDREAVTDSLIQFIFYYNELVREINILTRTERSIVDELTNLSQEERETALEKLGLLQGNLALNSLKSRLQRIMMDAYPTEAGNQLTLLAQLGISTNESGPGGGFDASRLRGYMEMNPGDVEAALQSYFRASPTALWQRHRRRPRRRHRRRVRDRPEPASLRPDRWAHRDPHRRHRAVNFDNARPDRARGGAPRARARSLRGGVRADGGGDAAHAGPAADARQPAFDRRLRQLTVAARAGRSHAAPGLCRNSRRRGDGHPREP